MDQKDIKKKIRYKSLETRRRSSVSRIIGELEEFKVEIEQRFAKSRFNHTFKFPRIGDKKPHEYVQSKLLILDSNISVINYSVLEK